MHSVRSIRTVSTPYTLRHGILPTWKSLPGPLPPRPRGCGWCAPSAFRGPVRVPYRTVFRRLVGTCSFRSPSPCPLPTVFSKKVRRARFTTLGYSHFSDCEGEASRHLHSFRPDRCGDVDYPSNSSRHSLQPHRLTTICPSARGPSPPLLSLA